MKVLIDPDKGFLTENCFFVGFFMVVVLFFCCRFCYPMVYRIFQNNPLTKGKKTLSDIFGEAFTLT